MTTPLPTNLDETYDDVAGDPSVKLHQQWHDRLHGAVNGLGDLGGVVPGWVYRDDAIALTNTTGVLDELFVTPTYISRTFSCTALSVRTGAATPGALLDLVLYGSTEEGLPGSLLTSVLNVDVSTSGSVEVVLPSPVVLPAGIVYPGWVRRGVATTMTCKNNTSVHGGSFSNSIGSTTAYHSGYTQNASTTIPTEFGSSFTSDRYAPVIWMRAAS